MSTAVQRLQAAFAAKAAEDRKRGAESYELSLRPGERLAVRYLTEPVPEYDLRSEEMTYGHARADFAVADKDAGKALALGTPIPTPGGWAAMGGLAVGDRVFGASGKPCRVVAATGAMGGRPCYRVTFDDGSSVVADAGHLWVSHTFRYRAFLNRARRGNPRPVAPELVTTEAMAETLELRRGKVTYRNHAVPCAGALDLPRAALPIDPYTLGVWLGDGSASRNEFVTMDPEIVAAVAAAGHTVTLNGAPSAAKGLARLYWVDREAPGRPGPFKAALRESGLLGRKSIPPEYLRASAPQRLALLAGLMDTDGSVSARGNSCEFVNTNPALAAGVAELVASLGWKAWLSSKQPKVAGRPELACARAHAVRFRPTAQVFNVKRKASRLKRLGRAAYPTATRRFVVSVEPVPSEPVRCIQVDSGDGLFLAGRAMVPTHNSALLEAIAEGHLERGNKVIDFWGSVDQETMAWGRSDWVRGRNVCIMHGPTVELDQGGIRANGGQPFDTKDANDMTAADYAHYDLIISSPKFFIDENGTKDFETIGRFLRRFMIHREHSKPIIYTIVREASEVIYSRIKADERQDEVKAQVLSALGQARHIGIALGLDTQRAVNVDKAFRDLADHTFFKRPRGENMPDEKRFAYNYVDLKPMLTMPRHQFVVVDTTGVGEGVNYMPPWHKREDDVIMPELGIVQRYVVPPEEGAERGDFRTIGDREHAQIMRLLEEGDGTRGPYTQREAAEAYGVSSATPNYHLAKHNEAVLDRGVCARCARAKGPFARRALGVGP